MKRAEIIIACRGELAENLHKTVDNVIKTLSPRDGVCVVFDGKQEVKYDLPKRVRVVDAWGRARGPGQCRHAGITSSDAEIVVLVDGHMTFPAGWIKTICDHLRDNPRDVTCCRMQSLKHDWSPMAGQGGYCGAYLATKTQEPGHQHWALSAKWLPQNSADGPVPAVMGACYGMRKNWYADIGEPLNLLEAWGGDEEILSVCSWMMGGRVYCLPVTVGHMYAAPYVRNMDREQKKNEQAEIWANRHAIIKSIPMTQSVRNDLLDWLCKNRIEHKAVKKCVEARQKRINALNIKLECAVSFSDKPCGWTELHKMGYIRDVIPTAKKFDLVQIDIARHQKSVIKPVARIVQTTCPLCDWPGYNGRCKKCGHRGRDVNAVKNLQADKVFRNAVEYNDQLGYFKRIIQRA